MNKWVCIFPGKMGLVWKLAYNKIFDTRIEAEIEADKYCNVIAVPVMLYEHLKSLYDTIRSNAGTY